MSFPHDHDEAYSDYRRDGEALWDGNDDAAAAAGEGDAGARGGGGRPSGGLVGRRAAKKEGVHEGWVYGALFFTVVAVSAITLLIFLSAGHLTESGGAPPPDGADNKLKSVNRNSAGIANSPKAHSQLELGAVVRRTGILLDVGEDTAVVSDVDRAARAFAA